MTHDQRPTATLLCYPTSIAQESAVRTGRDLGLVLGIALAARILFLGIMPPTAISSDLEHWGDVARSLRAGSNPYHDTSYLNWPPLWPAILFVLDRLSESSGVPLFRVIQTFLIGVESTVTAVLYLIATRFFSIPRLARLLIVGIALNPVAILLVCQHANFDGIVALCVLAFLYFVLVHARTADATDWLWACGFLGLGVVAKTVPLVLTPLLAYKARALTIRTMVAGALLLIAPAAATVGLLYLIDPVDIAEKVIHYRSFAGWFGITGLMHLLGADRWAPTYSRIFTLAMTATLVALAIHARRAREMGDRALVGWTAALLVAIPALGPGYGPQYLSWSLPLLVLLFAIGRTPLRSAIAAFGVIVNATDLVEYGLIRSHGMFLVQIHPSPTLVRWSDGLASQAAQTLLRIPLFAAYLALLGALAADIYTVAQTQDAPGLGTGRARH